MALLAPGSNGPQRNDGFARSGPAYPGDMAGAPEAVPASFRLVPAASSAGTPSPSSGRRRGRPGGARANAQARRPLGDFPLEEVLADYQRALVSRCLDDREITLQKQSRGFFHISGAGHEALGLGLARSLRPAHDWFFPYYRDRALVLALGVSPTEMLLQAVGAVSDPSSGGRQMPSHFGARRLNIVTQSSPTGSQCLPAIGCAEAGRYIWHHDDEDLGTARAHGDEVTYVSLGEGATSQGEFWESLNTACTLRLPVLFVVADNGYAISVPVSQQSPAPISDLVSSFPGLSVHRLDGRDYFQVRDKVPGIVAGVRAGQGPALVHATVTRPYSHSSADTQAKYRPKAELDDEVLNDPIAMLERNLRESGAVSADDLEQMRLEARRLVSEAAKEALAAPRPDPASIREHVWALPAVDEAAMSSAAAAGSSGDQDRPRVALGEAVRLALHEVMESDPRVRVFGEDVADAPPDLIDELEGKGGVFGTTFGLQRKFGPDRCYNTPLAEANIVGRAVGQAMRGLRPIPEVQFFDYIWTAMQQLKSEAATVRWRSAGEWSCPMVLRVPIGGYLAGGAIWHSQSGVSIFAHVPGLVIVMPSTAQDAVGLLRTAVAGEDPVLFLEHKHLLRQRYTESRYPASGFRLPFGKGNVVMGGEDLTIVTYGATVERSVRAAQRSQASAEVIDLRSLAPWDKDLVAESVARTGRLLVVTEDNLTCGFGAEVASWVGEHCFADLDAPVSRVAAADTHVAYEPTLERATLPQVEDIEAAIARLGEY
ncbi:MAG TPA: thiamine pyrophosphate-dependent enzyme [Acidimicrobiales bacterium]|nr:thiamine pyrophosphate-dependent enzyme [Acidimicrobiales bacterium]